MSDAISDEAWDAARRAWPEVTIPRDVFASYVAERSSAPSDGARLAELYLACACARGDAAALAAFERAFFGEIDGAAAKGGRGAPSADELRQILRHKLFVADPGELPKIAEYSGRGELRAWVRIVAVRTALNLATRARREVMVENDQLAFLVGTSDDPELAYFRRAYAAELRAAFAEAWGALDDRGRNLLRYAFGEGLTVDAIGAIYGVHRATAARWVARAHEELGVGVKKTLMLRLGAGQKDCASILRLLESQAPITLDRYLKLSSS